MLELNIDQTDQVAIKATQEIADIFYKLRWPSPPIITGGIVDSVVKAINAVLLSNQSSGRDRARNYDLPQRWPYVRGR